MQSKLHETNDELSDIILRLNSTNSEKKKKVHVILSSITGIIKLVNF